MNNNAQSLEKTTIQEIKPSNNVPFDIFFKRPKIISKDIAGIRILKVKSKVVWTEIKNAIESSGADEDRENAITWDELPEYLKYKPKEFLIAIINVDVSNKLIYVFNHATKTIKNFAKPILHGTGFKDDTLFSGILITDLILWLLYKNLQLNGLIFQTPNKKMEIKSVQNIETLFVKTGGKKNKINLRGDNVKRWGEDFYEIVRNREMNNLAFNVVETKNTVSHNFYISLKDENRIEYYYKSSSLFRELKRLEGNEEDIYSFQAIFPALITSLTYLYDDILKPIIDQYNNEYPTWNSKGRQDFQAWCKKQL